MSCPTCPELIDVHFPNVEECFTSGGSLESIDVLAFSLP